MFTTPAATPVTTPVLMFTEARLALLLLYVPPAGEPLKDVTALTHTLVAPLTVPGVAITVAITVREQPLLPVYTMPVLPEDWPVTTPEVPTEAISALMLDHVPPAGVPVSVTVLPVHITGVPAIVGTELTV